MSLTEEDLTQVRDIVIEAIQAVVVPRFDELKTDIAGIKGDIRVLKEDVAALKEDVAALKEDVRILKSEMREVKEDVRILKSDMREVKDSLSRLEGRLDALEADVKELYKMIAAAGRQGSGDKKLARLSIEQKVLKMYEDFQLLAKEAGVTLPR